MTEDALARHREQRIKQAYRELKERDPDQYQRCIRAAEVVSLNHGLSLEQAAAVEAAMVELAIDMKDFARG